MLVIRWRDHEKVFERAMILAPHIDDGEFGCGGTTARLLREGKQVYYVAFSKAAKSLPEGFPPDTLVGEMERATQELGIDRHNLVLFDYEVRRFPEFRQSILENLIRLNQDISPDIVFVPSSGDIHQDHHTIAMEGMRAFKRTTLLSYEIPWNLFHFNFQLYVHLDERDIDSKVRALSHYVSQKHKNYSNPDYIRNLAKSHGIDVGTEYAEVFEVIRWNLPQLQSF